MQTTPRGILFRHVSDVLALEHDMQHVIQRQMDDQHVQQHIDAASLIKEIALFTATRVTVLDELSRELGGAATAAKSVVAAAAGMLTELFGKVHHPPVSRMLRDDYAALALVATAYSMLYTASVALRHEQASTIAQRNLCGVTPLIMQLSRLIPEVVVAELALNQTDVDARAVDVGREATIVAWSQGPVWE